MARCCWQILGLLFIFLPLSAQSYFASNALRWQGEPLDERLTEGFVLSVNQLNDEMQEIVLWHDDEPVEWFKHYFNSQKQLTRLQQLSAEGRVLEEWRYLYREDGSLWMRLTVNRWWHFRQQGLWMWQNNARAVIISRDSTSFLVNQLRTVFVLDATLALQEEDFFNQDGELVRRKIYRYGELFLEQFYTQEGRRIEIYYVAGYAVLRQVYQGDQLLSEEVLS